MERLKQGATTIGSTTQITRAPKDLTPGLKEIICGLFEPHGTGRMSHLSEVVVIAQALCEKAE